MAIDINKNVDFSFDISNNKEYKDKIQEAKTNLDIASNKIEKAKILLKEARKKWK